MNQKTNNKKAVRYVSIAVVIAIILALLIGSCNKTNAEYDDPVVEEQVVIEDVASEPEEPEVEPVDVNLEEYGPPTEETTTTTVDEDPGYPAEEEKEEKEEKVIDLTYYKIVLGKAKAALKATAIEIGDDIRYVNQYSRDCGFNYLEQDMYTYEEYLDLVNELFDRTSTDLDNFAQAINDYHSIVMELVAEFKDEYDENLGDYLDLSCSHDEIPVIDIEVVDEKIVEKKEWYEWEEGDEFPDETKVHVLSRTTINDIWCDINVKYDIVNFIDNYVTKTSEKLQGNEQWNEYAEIIREGVTTARNAIDHQATAQEDVALYVLTTPMANTQGWHYGDVVAEINMEDGSMNYWDTETITSYDCLREVFNCFGTFVTDCEEIYENTTQYTRNDAENKLCTLYSYLIGWARTVSNSDVAINAFSQAYAWDYDEDKEEYTLTDEPWLVTYYGNNVEVPVWVDVSAIECYDELEDSYYHNLDLYVDLTEENAIVHDYTGYQLYNYEPIRNGEGNLVGYEVVVNDELDNLTDIGNLLDDKREIEEYLEDAGNAGYSDSWTYDDVVNFTNIVYEGLDRNEITDDRTEHSEAPSEYWSVQEYVDWLFEK